MHRHCHLLLGRHRPFFADTLSLGQFRRHGKLWCDEMFLSKQQNVSGNDYLRDQTSQEVWRQLPERMRVTMCLARTPSRIICEPARQAKAVSRNHEHNILLLVFGTYPF